MEKRKTTTSKAVKKRYADKRIGLLNQTAIALGCLGWRDLEAKICRGEVSISLNILPKKLIEN